MLVLNEVTMCIEDLDGCCSGTPLLSDDIWKKFELLDLPMKEFALAAEPEVDDELTDAVLMDLDDSLIRRHDCMWAGKCASKEHSHSTLTDTHAILSSVAAAAATTTQSQLLSTCIGSATAASTASSVKTHTTQAGRSVLRKHLLSTSSSSPLIRPDSPPVSDDDDEDFHIPGVDETATTAVLIGGRVPTIITDIAYDDSDEEEDEDDEEEERTMVASSHQPQTDHCYHKESFRMENLGVQTPSDSENEEVDVVSVEAMQQQQQQAASARLCSSLPNNPTSRDRQRIQRTVASAIISVRSKRTPRVPIKRRLDLETPLLPSSSSGRMASTTGVHKRGSGHRHHAGRKAARRRLSSDSEAEPFDKRNLHNNMERQRRVDLRNAFDDLRVLVPEVSGKERAAKVAILREAAAYCDALSEESAKMARQTTELKRHQAKLRAHLAQLRRSLAEHR